jgi:hypothetical protein
MFPLQRTGTHLVILELFSIFNLVSYELYMVVIFWFYMVKYMGRAWAGTAQQRHDVV